MDEFLEAAAELFLDTETRWSIPWVALRARQSGRPWGELDAYFWQSIAPTLVFNLYDVAGEWSGWDLQWLRQAVRQPPSDYRPIPLGLLRHWKCVETFFHWLEFPDHARTCTALAHLYLDVRWRLDGHLGWLLEQPWETLEDVAGEHFCPQYASLRVDGDPPSTDWDRHWNWLHRFHSWLQFQPIEVLEVCRQLEYALTLPTIAKVPRGPMVLQALGPHRELIQPCLSGPLPELYPAADLGGVRRFLGF